jgi:IS30 family transposase
MLSEKHERDAVLVIHDDASAAEVVAQTVSALKEATRHIGKVDRGYELAQIDEIEAALSALQNALRIKKAISISLSALKDGSAPPT